MLLKPVVSLKGKAMERFRNALITVGNNPNDPRLGQKETPLMCAFRPGLQGVLRYYECKHALVGRYVRITGVDINNYLNLYEVEIYGF